MVHLDQLEFHEQKINYVIKKKKKKEAGSVGWHWCSGEEFSSFFRKLNMNMQPSNYTPGEISQRLENLCSLKF